MKAEELDYCLADAEAGAIIFDAVAVDAVARARRARDLPRVVIGDAEDGTCRFDDWPPSGCTLMPRAGPQDLSALPRSPASRWSPSPAMTASRCLPTRAASPSSEPSMSPEKLVYMAKPDRKIFAHGSEEQAVSTPRTT
jgi:hypothetical protein